MSHADFYVIGVGIYIEPWATKPPLATGLMLLCIYCYGNGQQMYNVM